MEVHSRKGNTYLKITKGVRQMLKHLSSKVTKVFTVLLAVLFLATVTVGAASACSSDDYSCGNHCSDDHSCNSHHCGDNKNRCDDNKNRCNDNKNRCNDNKNRCDDNKNRC
jgi:hypothetical protein